MLRLLKKFIRTPYPYYSTFGRNLKNALISGAVVALVLLLYRPFGIEYMDVDYQLLKIAGFGPVCMIPLILEGLFKQFFLNKYLSGNRWTIGFELLLCIPTLLLIGVFNIGYIHFITQTDYFMIPFWRMELETFLIGMFPCAIILLKEQGFAAHFQKMLAEPTVSQTAEKQDAYELATDRERIAIVPENICCVKAEGNYIEITQCAADAKPLTYLLRMPLKEAEQKLSEQGLNLPKCHRSYLVNNKRISLVEGNAQGLTLHLDRGHVKVPVSRSYVNKFR